MLFPPFPIQKSDCSRSGRDRGGRILLSFAAARADSETLLWVTAGKTTKR